MNKLDAVNAVLRRIGLTPVSALDNGGLSVQAQAERYLDDADLACQARGWHFNTRSNVTLTRNASNKISVPESTYRIDTMGTDGDKDVTVVGGYLFDLENNTDVWSQDLVVTYVSKAAFTDLPQTFADYIISEAAFLFNRSHKKDKDLDALLQAEVARRSSEARREDNDRSDVNVLNTQDMNQLRGRPRMRDRSIY
jgi:hypothetical protein